MNYFMLHILPTAICVLICFLLAEVSIKCSKRFMKRRFDRKYGGYYSHKHRNTCLRTMYRRLKVYMISDKRIAKELI